MRLILLALFLWVNSGLVASGVINHAPAPVAPPGYQARLLPYQSHNSVLTLGAKSALAIDLATGQELYSQNAAAKVPIASITKLVSALVILKTHSLDEKITVSQLPTYGPDDDTIALTSGEQLSLRALMQAALIGSANDAIDALAISDSGSLVNFSIKMNQLVADWGITDAHFVSASGLTNTNNYASAQSLAKLAALVLKNPFLAQAVKTKFVTISDTAGRSFSLTSTNQLLGATDYAGIKTGYTLAAGQCLLSLLKIHGQPVIGVVLNSPDRFAETVKLHDWVEENYTWL